MQPEDHLRNGDLAAALAGLQDKVRAEPTNVKLRVFLFQLLCVIGDWDRAVVQLKVVGDREDAAIMMALTYREAIVCEVYRDHVFGGRKTPLVFGEPEPWLALLIEAQRLEGAGDPGRAGAFRQQAFKDAPASAGMINGAAFEWIADADTRLGPVLEVIVDGRYFWLPFVRIAELEIQPPSDLRDAVWLSGRLTLVNGGEVSVLVPTRYPATTAQGNDAEKLARLTRWVETEGGGFTGIGQRMLTTSASDMPIMELRKLVLDSQTSSAGDALGEER